MFAFAIIISSSAQTREQILKDFEGTITKIEKTYIIAVVYDQIMIFTLSPEGDYTISLSIVLDAGTYASCYRYLLDCKCKEDETKRVWISKSGKTAAYILFDTTYQTWFVTMYAI